MRVFHGNVIGEFGPVECVGVRFDEPDLAQANARAVGGFVWGVGERLDTLTSATGTRAPMPNQRGWFVRAVMPDVSWQGKNSIFSTFGHKFVETGTITLAELDEIAGDPLHRSRATEEGTVYDGSDYLGPAAERLRTVAKKDDEEELAVA